VKVSNISGNIAVAVFMVGVFGRERELNNLDWQREFSDVSQSQLSNDRYGSNMVSTSTKHQP
jgi:hypothetical protein